MKMNERHLRTCAANRQVTPVLAALPIKRLRLCRTHQPLPSVGKTVGVGAGLRNSKGGTGEYKSEQVGPIDWSIGGANDGIAKNFYQHVDVYVPDR
jgi:hypothetical protein